MVYKNVEKDNFLRKNCYKTTKLYIQLTNIKIYDFKLVFSW